MSSVRLSDIPRTTGFRLALLLLATFGAGALIVFGFLYFEVAGFAFRDIDSGLARDVEARADKSPAELARLVNERAPLDPASRRPFALFDSTGRWLAGSEAALPEPLPPFDQPFDLTLPLGGAPAPYRGILHQVGSGALFLAAESTSGIHRFQRLLAATMASGGLVILVIGLAGGMIAGAGALGRIDGVTRAIERIISGNLSERLPLGRSSGDLGRLVRVVNRMLDEIERLMDEVKGVTENIAHDLRTPLTRLLAGLERVRRRDATAEEHAEAIDEAIAETKSLLITFSALLRIAEIEAGARRVGFQALDLTTVVTDVADFYEPMAERKDVSLVIASNDAGNAQLVGDASLLFEAIGNLVDNAIKFTPVGGRVSVTTVRREARLGIEVSDTGPGIPEQEREAVLRRFHRVDKCRNAPGSGLGLSLVAAVAKLHGFDLVIEDANPGCRITLWHSDAASGDKTPDRQISALLDARLSEPKTRSA
jgi:signal transduction histidine kinase